MNKVKNEIAEAILVHAKSIDGLAKQMQWCFRTDFDENVADTLGKINNQFVKFNRDRERKAKDG
mgnify:CR=1 FL=1